MQARKVNKKKFSSKKKRSLNDVAKLVLRLSLLCLSTQRRESLGTRLRCSDIFETVLHLQREKTYCAALCASQALLVGSGKNASCYGSQWLEKAVERLFA